MPAKKRIRDALRQDELVLAALDRAERHRRNPERARGVLIAVLKEHAGLGRGGWATVRLRPQLERLEAARLIRRFKRSGNVVLSLTDAGQRRLTDARAAGKLDPLPEAPQHRRWRQAHEAARAEIDQLHVDVGVLLAEAVRLHEATPQPPSEAWFDLAGRLSNACEWLGAATYCSREWPEPDDAKADVTARRPLDTTPWSTRRTGPGVAGSMGYRA
jgi:hypothetical protein